MKSRLKNSIKVLIVLALTLLSLWGLANLCERKDSREKYADFFAQDEPFDVLFYGSSHMLDAVAPMELWRDTGIISYNLSGRGSYIPTTYWTMRNTVDHGKPKLVVLDTALADSENRTTPHDGLVHIITDGLPLSINKVKTIGTLYGGETYKWKDFLADFSLYHSRWNDLHEGDFNVQYNCCKGSDYFTLVAEPGQWELLPKGNYEVEETAGTKYIRQFIEYCQERDIDVLLVRVPYPSYWPYWESSDQVYGNAIQQIADEYGVNYINFFYEDSGVNFDTDLFDSSSHLNISGGRKITDYLGRFIKANYNIPDRRENPDYAFWYEDYKDYYNFKIGKINEQVSLYEYLMLLRDEDFYSEIQIDFATRADKADEKTQTLLENCKDYSTVRYTDDLRFNDSKCDILIHVYDAKTGEEVNTGAFNYAPNYNGNSTRIS